MLDFASTKQNIPLSLYFAKPKTLKCVAYFTENLCNCYCCGVLLVARFGFLWGQAQVRTVLYMAMMSAMQCNPVFKASYTRLVESGKPKKVAIIACVR